MPVSKDLSALTVLPLKEQIQLTPPERARYFKVWVWSNSGNRPGLLTNWVEVIPNKTYTVKQDQLMPAVLLSGSGR